MERLKMGAVSEVGVTLNKGSRQVGSIGGQKEDVPPTEL